MPMLQKIRDNRSPVFNTHSPFFDPVLFLSNNCWYFSKNPSILTSQNEAEKHRQMYEYQAVFMLLQLPLLILGIFNVFLLIV